MDCNSICVSKQERQLCCHGNRCVVDCVIWLQNNGLFQYADSNCPMGYLGQRPTATYLLYRATVSDISEGLSSLKREY